MLFYEVKVKNSTTQWENFTKTLSNLMSCPKSALMLLTVCSLSELSLP